MSPKAPYGPPVHTNTSLRKRSIQARRRIGTLFAAGACLVLAAVPPGVAAASSVVECGQLAAYTAPDPVTPTDGALTIGLLAPWVIAADANVSAAAAGALPAAAGSGPTCLALELDDSDVITALDFAPAGSIAGHVVEDLGIGGYILADRLLVPTFVTDAYPDLAAIFVTSAAAGTPVTATFDVDTTTGALTGVHASAAFCGPASLDGDGNGLVGDATIPAVLLDFDQCEPPRGGRRRKALRRGRDRRRAGPGAPVHDGHLDQRPTGPRSAGDLHRGGCERSSRAWGLERGLSRHVRGARGGPGAARPVGPGILASPDRPRGRGLDQALTGPSTARWTATPS